MKVKRGLMYKKILIPTDGSEISNAAARAGVEFAQQLGAEVIGLFVAPEYQYPVFIEIIPPNFPSEDEYLASMRKVGEHHLQVIADAAQAAGVKSSGITIFSDAAAREIVNTATQHGCDLIYIGSHGRSGWGGRYWAAPPPRYCPPARSRFSCTGWPNNPAAPLTRNNEKT